MAIGYKQDTRLLSLTTPLGPDVLLVRGFSGREELSRLFRFQLDLLSENETIAAKDIVGKAVTLTVSHTDQAPRYFNGVVNRFVAAGASSRGFRAYRAEVVPWLWFLTRTADCRIFQKKTVPEIIEQIFGDLGYTDYKPDLSATYEKWEYCVQYRETDFNFVSRLMEHEGIFYYFKHENGKHTMMLCDAKKCYQDCAEKEVLYSGGSQAANHISLWEHQYEFRSGKWAMTDYNFETPSTSLMVNTSTLVKLPGNDKFEIYDYPGEYEIKSQGTNEVKVRMEEEEVGYDVVTGASQCCTFSPGYKFTLKEHDIDAENAEYLLVGVHHSATDTSYTDGGPSEYSNSFSCIPQSVLFRPARQTPKPIVQGPHTAVVVGPKGEEIYTDKYGRVKVQFFWDREGKKDENTSCWVRVGTPWAGKQWGMIHIPRIGQEVIVAFQEGDPDLPIIVGSVYNAEQMPPFALPDNKTQSGMRSRSTLKGADTEFNELRFEDKKGSEDIYFHAEKDFHRVVENNDDLKVGSSDSKHCPEGSQTISVWKDRTTTIETGNETLTVKKGNRTTTIEKGDDTHDVKTGKRTVTVQADDTHEVKQGNHTVTIDQGNDTHQIKMGNREVKIDMGNDTLTISMGNQTTKLNLGASSTEAMQSITLKVGQNSIVIDQTGVTIKGLMVTVEGQIQTQVKGVMTTINGSAMLQLSGGVIMVG